MGANSGGVVTHNMRIWSLLPGGGYLQQHEAKDVQMFGW
jgi:hypothetical protein